MKFDDICKLQQKKFRERFGHFLVEGEHLVQELENAARTEPALRACELYVTHEQSLTPRAFPTHVITPRQMEKLSETRSPQGIVAVVPLFEPRKATAGERAICLYEIQDPGNLGTILRTLAWFGGFRCLLTTNSVDVFNAKVIRASMGAIFHLPFEIDVPIEDIQQRYPRIGWLHTQGASVQSQEFQRLDAYLFGNEARGVDADTISKLGATPYAIRGDGHIESLNVAAAVNICAYELCRHRLV